MGDIRDKDSIEALRKRLYQRGNAGVQMNDIKKPEPEPEFEPPEKPQVATTWSDISVREAQSKVDSAERTPEPEPEVIEDMPKKKRTYRIYTLIGAVGFFVFAALLSGIYMFFGGNTISGENISITIDGPFTVGGGEILPIQVAITNANAVPVESATLIIQYPEGTQSHTDVGAELLQERIPLERIADGETINIPIKALVFGEEDQERVVTAAVEYRVAGSNATFFKDAEPLRFKISSSPVSVDASSVKRVSSGQEVEIVVKVQSNASNELADVVLQAEYPFDFDFIKASPAPVSGQNFWLIESLEPGTEEEIVITGILSGKENDERVLNFLVGVPAVNDRFSLASVYGTDSLQFEIEQPFIDLSVLVEDSENDVVTINKSDSARVEVFVRNPLDSIIYDGKVVVAISGTAVDEREIRPSSGGFYDSSANTIVWDSNELKDLAQIEPGKAVRISFSLKSDESVSQTPLIAFDVNVEANRVRENAVAEVLTGTASRELRVESEARLVSDVSYGTGIFPSIGPVPPVAEQLTQYTVTLVLEGGSNDLTNAVVTSELPGYTNWLNLTSGVGDVTFESIRRTLTWDVGDLEANQSAVISFQIGLLPSLSQVGIAPTLIRTQNFKATDRFTGSTVRSSAAALTTELSEDFGFSQGNGIVRDEE